MLADLNLVHEVPRQHQKIISVRASLRFGNDRYPGTDRISPPFFRVALRRGANHGVIEPEHLQQRIAFRASAVDGGFLAVPPFIANP